MNDDDNTPSREMMALRLQAWARAKGELEAILFTYFGRQKDFEKVKSIIRDFQKQFEDML